MRRHDVQDATGVIAKVPGYGVLQAFGAGAPTASAVGFAKGCLWHDVTNGALYMNTGTSAAATWVLLGSAGGTLSTLTVTTLSDTTENAGMGASTAAAGTTVADAGALPAGTAKVYPTTAADDTKGVVISTSDKVTGRTLFIGNGVSNKILKVYGPSGAVINGAAADAAFSSASGKGVIAVCLLGSANTWLAW